MTEPIKRDPEFKQKSLDQMKKVAEFAQNYGGGRLRPKTLASSQFPEVSRSDASSSMIATTASAMATSR